MRPGLLDLDTQLTAVGYLLSASPRADGHVGWAEARAHHHRLLVLSLTPAPAPAPAGGAGESWTRTHALHPACVCQVSCPLLAPAPAGAYGLCCPPPAAAAYDAIDEEVYSPCVVMPVPQGWLSDQALSL